MIARRDAPDAVVMSFDHYSSLMETVHLLSSSANAAHLARSLAQLQSPATVHAVALAALARAGLDRIDAPAQRLLGRRHVQPQQLK